MYNREFASERIVSLGENEIFVFGSNLQGRHGAVLLGLHLTVLVLSGV